MILKYITTEQAITYLQEKQYDLVEDHDFSRECLDARGKEKYDIYEKIIQDVKKYATMDFLHHVNHGRWLNQLYARYECSECGFYETSTPWRYCPNCGAKMEVEE